MLDRQAGARVHFKYESRKCQESCSDVTVRENPDELTLRAEEVETSKALININHIEPERWGPLLVDADWCAFCQALYKGIDGEDWEEMYESCKESLFFSLFLFFFSLLLLFFFSSSLFSLFFHSSFSLVSFFFLSFVLSSLSSLSLSLFRSKRKMEFPPLWITTGMPSARRCTKASKEKIEKKYMSLTKK